MERDKSLEACTKTVAAASITWDRGNEGTRDALGLGPAARRRHAIHHLFVEVFGTPKEEDWAALDFHQRLLLPRVVIDMPTTPGTSYLVLTPQKATNPNGLFVGVSRRFHPFKRRNKEDTEKPKMDLITNGSTHRGAKGVAMPTDEDDQDGHFFYNHPERGGYFAA